MEGAGISRPFFFAQELHPSRIFVIHLPLRFRTQPFTIKVGVLWEELVQAMKFRNCVPIGGITMLETIMTQNDVWKIR